MGTTTGAVARAGVPGTVPAEGPGTGRKVVLALLLPLAFLALWAAAVRYRWLPEGIVPSPQQVVRSWYVWIVGTTGFTLSPYSGTWLDTVLFSGRRVLQGFALAALIGIPLGILIGWSRLVQDI
ncbi:MAG TPA: ABC transporter permease, partial [Methylomirabilota bacterium]|nr:ABC transporter permease [Methylomirabilota bacterium]